MGATKQVYNQTPSSLILSFQRVIKPCVRLVCVAVCVCVRVCVRERERESVCVFVCVRERDCVGVCVCLGLFVPVSVYL